MNFKTMSPITILLIVIIVLAGTVGVIYALTTFNKDYTFTPNTEGFLVYTDQECTDLLTNELADLGPIPSSYTLTYCVKNTGYVPITVYLDANVAPETAAELQYPAAGVLIEPETCATFAINLIDVVAEGTLSVEFNLEE